MKITYQIFSFFLIVCLHVNAQNRIPETPVKPGVSLQLAQQRHKILSNIQYRLDFNIPRERNADIAAVVAINFKLKTLPDTLQLDFMQTADHVKGITVNAQSLPVLLRNEHILIPKRLLKLDANSIEIKFTAGNASLNRNEDFLYALFVPDHARTVFPCFDQPDLKARFQLNLTVPKDWNVLANAAIGNLIRNEETTTYHFLNSDLLPTYLFSFTAGKYTPILLETAGRKMEFLHRENDSTKIKLSTDSIFKAHSDAIDFLEQWTKRKFPFQKIGFVAIPDFQFGGMEHPGEVQYKSSSLFLDEGATKDQFISRSNLISHETAHMWFGDLVTMKWFNDVWMKEVFANFMADKVTEKLMGKSTFNLKFLQDHYPAAYAIDRTSGANPIRQQLDNLNDAGSMYGNIIYHKAPIMMRQLESLMGTVPFQKGIREYLQKYAYGNATWDNLISILAKYSKSDLYAWNKVWVNQPGRPVFKYSITYNQKKINTLKISQQAEKGSSRIWPQAFSITMVYSDRIKTIPVNMNAAELLVQEAKGLDRPEYILFNSDGIGYGIFPIDKPVLDQVFDLKDPVARASAYINAYENMLSGETYKATDLLNAFTRGLSLENNEMNIRLLSGYITNLFWTFTLPDERKKMSTMLENSVWTAMENQKLPNIKKNLFTTFQNIYLTEEAGKKIYTLWAKQEAPAGVKLIEDDYTALALTLALKSDSGKSILSTQLKRIKNVDRKNRFVFLMPALSSDPAERDLFFESLTDRKNRQKEAWVTSALSYLHHPLRQNTSKAYLAKSLGLLVEIKNTGDIFFPQSWLGSIFGNYQTEEAWHVVEEFLKKHPDYSPKLKDKILQSTDNLYRAQRMLFNPQPE